MRPLILMLILGFSGLVAYAGEGQVAPALEGRYYGLLKELRCLVCQNESLYESQASLAEDLRKEVREMLAQGRSDDEILSFMTARYGDYVLYRPRLRPANYLLWFGPWLLLAAGVFTIYAMWKRQRGQESPTVVGLDEDERRRLRDLLGEDHQGRS